MQRLEVSAAVRHIYIYIYIYMSLGFKRLNDHCHRVSTHLQSINIIMYPQYYYTNYCKHYRIPECTRYQIVFGQFIRGPDDESKQSKHVARKQQSIINLLCFDCICISLLFQKHLLCWGVQSWLKSLWTCFKRIEKSLLLHAHCHHHYQLAS